MFSAASAPGAASPRATDLSGASALTAQPFFGNWMVAVAEAAALAGVESLDDVSTHVLARAWDIVAQAAGMSHEELAIRVAAQQHLAMADLRAADLHADKLLPGSVARRRTVLPLRHSDRDLVVATANPLSVDAKREVARLSGRTVHYEVAAPRRIAEAIEDTYGASDEGDEPPAVSIPQPSGPHVLVVDDEAGARALFRSVLADRGFRVSMAQDGPEAIALLEKDPTVDLVTLDYWMEKMNGLRVLQQIRARRTLANMPVIMVTGAESREIEMSLFEAGADDYIAKPIDAPLYVLRIRAVLRRRRLR